MASQGDKKGLLDGGMSKLTIIGSFADDQRCAHAIEALRESRLDDFNTFSPIPSHRIEHAIGKSKSPVRWLVLAGGITGVLSGLAITIGTTYEWRLNAGGKPLLSWPPFIVICFELMILLGGISGFTGVLAFAQLPALKSVPNYKSRFAEDRFGLVVRCDSGDAERVEAMFKKAGADEVTRAAA